MHEDDSACPQSRRAKALLIYSVVAIFAAATGVGATLTVRVIGSPPRPPTVVRAPATMNEGAVYRKVEPTVVDVSANLQYLDETAEGTGFVFDAADGLVLTNNHVIDDATNVTVTAVSTGKVYRATILGYDLRDDVAVLKIKGGTGLKAATIGDSDSLTVGTQVLALGNEAGQGGPPTLAAGVISSMGRSIIASDQSSGLTETLHGMLQTSADIRPGDSGGPLANAAGQVIGIDTAAGSGSSGTSFAGYAIPINKALSMAELIAAGRANPAIKLGMPAFLGVLLPDSASSSPLQQAGQQHRRNGTATRNESQCLTGGSSSYTAVPAAIAPVSSGALVDGVVCGGPAVRAGLAAGDVITSLGAHAITSARSLTSILAEERPGTRTSLTWVGIDGANHAATVTLGTAPAG